MGIANEGGRRLCNAAAQRIFTCVKTLIGGTLTIRFASGEPAARRENATERGGRRAPAPVAT